MLLPRRLQPRRAARTLAASAVAVTIAVALTAAPARAAIFIPPSAAATLASANPANNTPHTMDGSVRAYAQIGNTIYVGGAFTFIKAANASAWSARNHLFAYDLTTGAIRTGFNPRLDGAVNALEVSPTGRLIVGGAFRTVNGVARRNLVALDPATGATVGSWVGRADGGIVRRMVLRGNDLYIGGAFHWINGTQHSLLARLNATTGAIDPTFRIDASVARRNTELVWGLAVSPDNRTLVATGNFTVVNGLSRNQVVMVDLAGTPTVADWHTDRYVPPCSINSFPFYARDVDFSDDGSYFVIAADGATGAEAYCDTVTRWETSQRGSNLRATWVAYTGRDSVTAIEAAENTIYAGGHFRWMNNANGVDKAGPGAVNRYGLAALDPNNGMPYNWNPTRSPGSNLPAGGDSWGPVVWELWRGPTGVYAGYDSDGLGNEYHGRMGMFPYAGGRTVPVVDAPQSTPGYLYLGAGDRQVTKAAFDGSILGTPELVSQPNLTSARSAFVVSNRLYWARTNPSAPSGSVLQVSAFNRGAIGAPWVGSAYNSWFGAGNLTGAFYLNGRMYHTVAGANTLFYRYLEHDGFVVGCTSFVLPTRLMDWSTVRGMTWVNGRLVYGSVDGTLRSVPFDPTAASGFGVDGSATAVIAPPSGSATWSNPTLFYATS